MRRERLDTVAARAVGALAMVALLMSTVVACHAAGVEERHYLGLPEGLDFSLELLDRPATLLWGDGADELLFVAYGSGNCPVLVQDMTWESDDRVTLTAGAATPPLSGCTGDLSPTTSVLRVDPDYGGGSLRLVVEFPDFPDARFEVELPPQSTG